MTGPMPEQDPYAALLADDDPYAALLEDETNDKKPGSISNFFRSIVPGALKGAGDILLSAAGGNPSNPTALVQALQGKKNLKEKTDQIARDTFGADLERTSGKVGSTVGEIAAGLPLFGGIDNAARGVNFLAPRVAKAGETALQAGTRAAVQAIPRNVLTGVAGSAMLDPELVTDPERLATVGAMSVLGAAAEGAFAGRAVSKALAEEVSAATANGVAPTASPRFNDLLNQIDEVKASYLAIAEGDPLTRAGMKPKPELEIVNPRNVKEWNPKIGKRTLLPSGEEVQYFAGEAAELNASRVRISRRLATEYDRLQRQFSQDRLSRIQALEDELKKVTDDLDRFVQPEIGRSTNQQTGLKFSENKNPKTVIRFGANTAENFGDGAYPYNAPGSNVPPYQTVTSAPQNHPIRTSTGSAAEEHFAGRIDYGNAAAKQARKAQESLLGPLEKVKYTLLDDLLPMKKLDQDTYDLMTRFHRIGAKMHQATEEALYIPTADGGYTKGPAGLATVFQELTDNPTAMRNWNDFVQAKQAASGIETPFDPQLAAQRIDEVLAEFPDFARIYDEIWQPMQKAKIDMMKGYGLIKSSMADEMLKNENYASLARSTFGNPSLGFLRGRKNPSSEKLVGDIFESEYASTRALVFKGEQNKILRSLAEAKLKNPDLPGVEFVPPQNLPGMDELIAQLPADMLETVKKAVAEAAHIPAKGSSVYKFLMNEKEVYLKVDGDAKMALQNLFGMEPIAAAIPSGTAAYNPAAWIPKAGQAYAQGEKTISHVYSVYRDLFGGGLPLDAVEASINAKSEPLLKGFNMLRDPVKGFLELTKNTDRAALIRAHGGHTAIRYADPTAELSASSVEQLAKRANLQKGALRFVDPRNFPSAFKEFAGNLSNSVRMGATLRALENGATFGEAVDIGNRLLGDPFTRGAATAGLARYTQFFAYPMQANARAIGTLTNPQRAGMALARGAGMLSVPTAAIWLWNRQDPEVNEKIRAMRNDPFGSNYLYVRKPGGGVEAFRKPFLYSSIFMTPVEQMLDALAGEGNEEAIQQIASSVAAELVPNMVPLLAGGVIENMTGGRMPSLAQSLMPGYRDFPLVSRSTAGLLPEDQGTESTNLARTAAELTGTSAAKWDNIFRSVFLGGMWKDFQALDELVGGSNKPELPESYSIATPLFGGRKANTANAGTGELRKFYQFYNEVTPAAASFARAVQNGQAERAQEIEVEHSVKFNAAAQVAAYKKHIDDINAAMNMLRNTEAYDPKEKREQLDYYNQMRIQLARQANAELKDLLNKQ